MSNPNADVYRIITRKADFAQAVNILKVLHNASIPARVQSHGKVHLVLVDNPQDQAWACTPLGYPVPVWAGAKNLTFLAKNGIL